jgi:hypothetical protein
VKGEWAGRYVSFRLQASKLHGMLHRILRRLSSAASQCFLLGLQRQSFRCYCTANEGPVKIQYNCLVPIFMYSQKWNCAASLFPKHNYNVLSPNSYTHISVRDLYISRIGLSILLQPNIWTDPWNISIVHRHMNVEIRMRPCNSQNRNT